MLGPQDAEAYQKLRLEALLNSPEAFKSSYGEVKKSSVNSYKVRFQSENSNSYNVGAFEEDLLIGVVTLVREAKQNVNHRTTIYSVYVTPDQRTRGVGKQLLQAAVNHAKSLEGVEQVKIAVPVKDETMKSFYYALGFVPFGTHKRAVKLGNLYYDEEHMVMFL